MSLILPVRLFITDLFSYSSLYELKPSLLFFKEKILKVLFDIELVEDL